MNWENFNLIFNLGLAYLCYNLFELFFIIGIETESKNLLLNSRKLVIISIICLTFAAVFSNLYIGKKK